jgi:hypothetical protein
MNLSSKTVFSAVFGIVALVVSASSIRSESKTLTDAKTVSVKPPADEITVNFHNPPNEARPYVWWHWMNGNVTREGITRDLEAFAKAGIGGGWIFNMGHSFTCKFPAGPAEYMSEPWLELMKFAASEAKRLGLKLGFHNCAGWSTMGGPWIEPKDGSQKIVSTFTKHDGGKRIRIKLAQPEANLNYYLDIAVLAYPTPKNEEYRVHHWPQKSGQAGCRTGRQPELDECPADAAVALKSIVDVSKYMSKDGTLVWDAPKGNWTILRLGHTPTGKTNHPAADGGLGLEVNKLSREGVDVHWENGIKPLLDKLGPLAGDSFNSLLIDSYEAGANVWTTRMREEFTARRGYDPTPYLLTMCGRLVEDGPTTDRFLWDFRRTISDLYTDNFYGYFADLCRENGLKSAIEPYAAIYEGMAVAAKADLPMGEFWSVDPGGGYLGSLKFAASIAHINGRNLVGAEAFTANPETGKWKNYPGKLKLVGDSAWAHGINRLVVQGMVHQPFNPNIVPGMTFGQWGSHIDRNVTWFEPASAWFKYMGRSQYLLQHGEFAADVLAFVGEAVPNRGARLKGLKEAGYDFDGCGTDIFAQLKVDKGDIVLPCGRRYKLLKMPDVVFQSPKIARKVRELVEAGAAVLSPKPKHNPTLTGSTTSEKEVLALADKVWGKCDGKTVTSNRFGKGRVFCGISAVEALQNLGMEPAIQLPEANPKMQWLHRYSPDADVFYISNQSGKQVNAIASFRTTGRRPEFFDAEKGTITNAAGWAVQGRHTRVPLNLSAEKSIFVVFRHPGKPAPDPVIRAETSSGDPLVFDKSNTAGFLTWRNGVHTLRHTSGKSRKVEVADIPTPLQLSGPWDVSFQKNRGAPETARFDKLISWPRHNDPGVKYFSGTATYSIKFGATKDILKKNQQIWLDLGKVDVIAQVRVNGKDLGVLWHSPFMVDVTDALRAGTNTLQVDVTNLWINRLIGDEQYPDDRKWNNETEGKFPNRTLAEWPDWLLTGKQRPVKERVTFTTWRHWGKDDKLQSSGLIGPVKLRCAQRIK